ncbi:MAG: PfkB family carbohydrate kinase [Deltaproteobacteria bacterium]|nr:PfkB family carbohydrate kinase [Deltaproteobacteria bacterium]
MIYTLTLNPALDYLVTTPNLSLGTVNRALSHDIRFGGKGINVSVVLKNLGVSSVAMGFLAGSTGQAMRRGLKNIGLRTDFIDLQNGFTRINIKIKNDQPMEIHGPPPEVTSKEIEELIKRLALICPGDTMVFGGNVPDSVSSDIYTRIMETLSPRQVLLAVDAQGKTLANALPFKPILVRLDGYSQNAQNENNILDQAIAARDKGAQNVICALSAHEVILAAFDRSLLKAQCPVSDQWAKPGVNDSMMAGFLAGLNRGLDSADCLKLATASAAAASELDSLATRSKIESLLAETIVTEV